MSTHFIHSNHDLILRYPRPPWWGYLCPSYRSTLTIRWAGSAGYWCVPLQSPLLTHHSWAVLTFQLFQKTHLWVWISARTPSCGHPSIQVPLKPSEFKPNHLSSALFTKGAEGVMMSCALCAPTGQSLLGVPAGSRKPGGSDRYPSTGIFFRCLVIFNSEHPIGHNLV